MLSPQQKEELDDIFEDMNSYTGEKIAEDELFDRVVSFIEHLLDRELGRREEIINWCKERCEANIKAFGTDKWNGDLEELIQKYENI